MCFLKAEMSLLQEAYSGSCAFIHSDTMHFHSISIHKIDKYELIIAILLIVFWLSLFPSFFSSLALSSFVILFFFIVVCLNSFLVILLVFGYHDEAYKRHLSQQGSAQMNQLDSPPPRLFLKEVYLYTLKVSL